MTQTGKGNLSPRDVAATTQVPSVSILIRSMGRPTLLAALASIAQQTYRPIEVVVINAKGGAHPPLPDMSVDQVECRLIDSDIPLARATAANLALRHARGRWLMFLDDDDTMDPGHVERLYVALRDKPGTRLAHGGVRIVDANGKPSGVLDEPVDRASLWLANRLAIHAALFSREIVDDGLQFDERFLVYEDWDFWFRISAQERFLHVPGTSATYRLIGSSGATVAHDPDTSRQLREPFYRKWLPALGASDLEQLAAHGENTRSNLSQALKLLDEAHSIACATRLRLEGQVARLEAQVLDTQRLLDQSQERCWQLTAAADNNREAMAKSGREHARLLATYAELEQGYRALTSSLSWRITRPLRAVRRLAHKQGRVDFLRRIWQSLPLAATHRLRLREWLIARDWGRSLVRRLVPQLVSERLQPLPPPLVDKERVRSEAESALGGFLARNDRIDLTCRASEPEVSVVVVLFNQAGLSLQCLQSLASSEGVSLEVLLVDNGSTDRVPQLLDRVDGATILRPGENLGFLRAVNLAANQARGRYLVLLNNDAMLEPQTLHHAAERLRADSGAGAVGGQILLWNGTLQEAGSIVWHDGSCQGYGRGDDPARPEYCFVRDVDYCSGAFLMVRGALFSALGGLDTAFVPAYYEESDFCLRLWEHGHRVVYDPAVRIRHFEFASEVAPGWAVELQQRHRALFVERHPSFLAAQPNPSSLTTLKARARLAAGCRRVLVIDDRVPLPWLGQGYPRAASWIAAMATQGHAVTHYPLQFPREDWSDVRRALPDTVEVMLNHGTPALADFLLERQGLYDVVIISRPHNMQVLSRLLKQQPTLLGSATLVYDAEALFSLREIARAALDKRPLSAAEQQQRVVKELALTRDANCVVAVSEAEAAHFRDAGYSQVEVIGHAIDKALDTPGFGARQDLLFVGALNADDTPNSDSVRWFVTEVWPAVRKALGDDIRLHVVGTCEAPSVRALAAPDVILHGRAEALAPHLDTARVFVVPTRYAAGIPHKAHEAAARGLPMVVTPLIAGQLGWDSFVTVGVDAVAFASACVNLHQNEAAWQYQREELYAAIDRDCSPHAFRQAVARVLEWTPTSSQSHEVGVSVGGIQTLGVDAGLEAVTDEQRTAALWGRDAAQRADVMRQRRHWSSHPVTAAEINRLISGDASVGWVEHLKHTRFPRERARGMSLGCGSGAVVIDALRLGIVQQMEGIDLSSGAIEIATARSAAAGLGKRARFQVANVNAMEIQGPLDLIVFEQSLHHVDALDTVLGNCAAALALDGWLVVNEYVGPDRFQWSGEAERLMNAILERLPDGYKRHPDDGSVKLSMQRVDPQAVIDLDPSEAIHSSAIIGALEARFECVERRDFGGTLLQFLLADIAANFDPDDYRDVALLRLTTLLETELIRCGVIGSDFVYAVYRHKISDHQLGP